ncbi:hypothetical protein EYR40_004644 [Pleurotus pulmonarius]|nr:hypothetical protein EYR38_001887 [Pleurotus pulmonarius]KAF4605853.1 hypothetical protein EYR40_004644 [Pleurotus pulmonarius]
MTSSSSAVAQILQRMVTPAGASSQASNSRKTTSIVKQAHNEANKGLLSASKTAKRKRGASTVDVGYIYINPHGVTMNGDVISGLVKPLPPTRYDLELHPKQLLARNLQTGFQFSISASEGEIQENLASILPEFYSYLASLPESSRPAVLMCIQYYKELRPLRTILPKGEDLYAYIGAKKKSLPENILYIATVDPIPSAIIKEWEETNASELGINLRHGDDEAVHDQPAETRYLRPLVAKPAMIDLTDTDQELDEDAPTASKVLEVRSSFSDDPILKVNPWSSSTFIDF